MNTKELRQTKATQKAVSRIAELYEQYGKTEDARKARRHSESLKKLSRTQK